MDWITKRQEEIDSLDVKHLGGWDKATEEESKCKYCLEKESVCECTLDDVRELLGYEPKDWRK